LIVPFGNGRKRTVALYKYSMKIIGNKIFSVVANDRSSIQTGFMRADDAGSETAVSTRKMVTEWNLFFPPFPPNRI